MKRLFIFFTICFAALLAGCNNIDIENSNENLDDDMCMVSFNPTGEIITSDAPLAKGSIIMTDDVYIAQAYRIENDGHKYFAFGFFDNIQNMKLYLKKDAKYRIVVSVIKNGKILFGDYFNMSQNSLYCDMNNQVNSIRDYRSYDSSSDLFTYRVPLNRFFYNLEESYIYYYSSETSTGLSSSSISFNWDRYYSYKLPFIETTKVNGTSYPTCDDWFYGEVSEYAPTGSYENLDMNFKRVGFKLKYELQGVTDGEVTVKVYNDTRTFIENTTATPSYEGEEQFIAFHDAKSAWQYADDYAEKMYVSVVWKRSIGITQGLGVKEVQVKRNCLNNIRISLGSDDRGAGVLLNIEDDSAFGGSSVTDIPVEQ